MEMRERAASLFAQLGYEGCRDLREALRQEMADHRARVAAERHAAGLVRPRSTRNRTTLERMAAGMDMPSEATMGRVQLVARWRPDLMPMVEAGSLSAWSAYLQARKARDASAVRAVIGD